MRDEIDPGRELARTAAVRDLLFGVALLAIGLITGGSTLDGVADGIDYAFDGLAFGLIAWALVRFVRPRR